MRLSIFEIGKFRAIQLDSFQLASHSLLLAFIPSRLSCGILMHSEVYSGAFRSREASRGYVGYRHLRILTNRVS